jgi:hypothetical protein
MAALAMRAEARRLPWVALASGWDVTSRYGVATQVTQDPFQS